MKLTIINPIKDAAHNMDGLERIGGASNNWKTRKYCWDCGKDTYAKGGKMFGAFGTVGRGRSGPVRFKCAACIAKSDIKEI